MTVNASTSPQARTQKIVIGIYAKNFPRTPGSIIIGINTTIVVLTHEIIGTAYSWRASISADFGEYPILTFALAA